MYFIPNSNMSGYRQTLLEVVKLGRPDSCKSHQFDTHLIENYPIAPIEVIASKY